MVQQVARLQQALNETRAALLLGPIITRNGFDTTDEAAATAAIAPELRACLVGESTLLLHHTRLRRRVSS